MKYILIVLFLVSFGSVSMAYEEVFYCETKDGKKWLDITSGYKFKSWYDRKKFKMKITNTEIEFEKRKFRQLYHVAKISYFKKENMWISAEIMHPEKGSGGHVHFHRSHNDPNKYVLTFGRISQGYIDVFFATCDKF